MLSFLLNVLWFVLGGLLMGLGWWLAGLISRGGESMPRRPIPAFGI
jgi:hypothetical protein